MGIEEFINRIRELNLRFVLKDIDQEIFVKIHDDIIFERICCVVAEYKQLQQYTDLIVRWALPDHKKEDAPQEGEDAQQELILDNINRFLLGDKALGEFIDVLRRARIKERGFVTNISFGVFCCGAGSETKPSFAEFIPSGAKLPIIGSYSQRFRMIGARQAIARIPLGYRVGIDTEPERLDGVEFRLPEQLETEDELVVTLTPSFEPKRVLIVLECNERNYRKEALLEFDDTPHNYAQANEPAPPEHLTGKLRHLVNRGFEYLNNISSNDDSSIYNDIKESLKSACYLLSVSDEERLEKAYEKLIARLQLAGSTAEGFFAYKALEHVFQRLGHGQAVIRTEFDQASELLNQLYLAARHGDVSQEKKIADSLYELARNTIIEFIKVEKFWASEEIDEFFRLRVHSTEEQSLAIQGDKPADVLQRRMTFVNRISEPVVVDLSEWLTVMIASPDRLITLMSEFLELVTDMSNELRAKLIEDLRYLMTHKDDEEVVWEAYWQLIGHLQEAGFIAKGFFAYKFIEDLPSQVKNADIESIIPKAASLFGHLSGPDLRNDAEQQKQTAKDLTQIAIDWLLRSEHGEYVMGRKRNTKELLQLLAQSESRGYLLERADWFLIMTTPPDRLARTVMEFLASPFSVGISETMRLGLKSDANRIAEIGKTEEWLRLEKFTLSKHLEKMLDAIAPPAERGAIFEDGALSGEYPQVFVDPAELVNLLRLVEN